MMNKMNDQSVVYLRSQSKRGLHIVYLYYHAFFFTETRGRSPTHTWHTHNIWFILLSTFVQRSDSNMHAHYIRTEYSPKLLLHVECNLMCWFVQHPHSTAAKQRPFFLSKQKRVRCCNARRKRARAAFSFLIGQLIGHTSWERFVATCSISS